MDVNALQKLGTGGVGEASKGNLAHPEAYLPLDAQPYLSMLDYQIICDQGSGSVHSKEYGLSEQEFQIRQSQAVQKILHLSSQINKNISIKDPILTALSELGFQPSALGVQELREAIQLILNNKEWIHHMQDQVYPRVAQKFGCKSPTAVSHMRSAIKERKIFCRWNQRHPAFVDDQRLQGNQISVRRFCQVFIQYLQVKDGQR